MFSQVLTREQASEIRRIMNMVTEGGTATGAMAPVKAAGIRSGGKTGTAQKAVPVIDPKTGEPKRRLVIERDPKGKIIGQHEEIVMEEKLRSDAWYLSFAPLEKPVMAMAVLLEGPGPGISFYGGKNAGPSGGPADPESESARIFWSCCRSTEPATNSAQSETIIGLERALVRAGHECPV